MCIILSLDPQKPHMLTLQDFTSSTLEIGWLKSTSYTGPTFYTVTAIDSLNGAISFSNNSSTAYKPGTFY